MSETVIWRGERWTITNRWLGDLYLEAERDGREEVISEDALAAWQEGPMKKGKCGGGRRGK